MLFFCTKTRLQSKTKDFVSFVFGVFVMKSLADRRADGNLVLFIKIHEFIFFHYSTKSFLTSWLNYRLFQHFLIWYATISLLPAAFSVSYKKWFNATNDKVGKWFTHHSLFDFYIIIYSLKVIFAIIISFVIFLCVSFTYNC